MPMSNAKNTIFSLKNDFRITIKALYMFITQKWNPFDSEMVLNDIRSQFACSICLFFPNVIVNFIKMKCMHGVE